MTHEYFADAQKDMMSAYSSDQVRIYRSQNTATISHHNASQDSISHSADWIPLFEISNRKNGHEGPQRIVSALRQLRDKYLPHRVVENLTAEEDSSGLLADVVSDDDDQL